MSYNRNQITTPASSRTGPMPSNVGRARLRVLFTPSAESLPPQLELGIDDIAIGRDVASRGLMLNDERASRLHCRVCWDPHSVGYRVGDAGSSNGTLVNGQPVQTALLRAGDVLRVGGTLLLYEVDDLMGEVRRQAERAAKSNCNILVQGETGVGKEVFARLVHSQSGLSGEFVPVNCGALPAELIGSELFGHSRGAFSGAERQRRGLFLAADGGTLFLDELGELPLEQQPVLLRAIEERRVRPLGADREVPVRVRIVAATQVDLEGASADGRFRADLYARVAQVVLRLPPVRERRSEILPLLRQFLQEAGRGAEISANAAELLLLWRWPHNVREIKALAASFVALAEPGGPLNAAFLRQHKPKMVVALNRPAESSNPPPPDPRSERVQLRALLGEHHGNVAAVARALGKRRSQIYRLLERFSLSPRDFRR